MLKIGWASRDMTPDRPAMIQGQMHRRIGRQALDPLTVTALAIEGGAPADSAIVISADIAFVSQELIDAVRVRLGQRVPWLPADRAFMTATHTHDSFVLDSAFYGEPDGDVMSPAEAVQWVAGHASDAAAEAWAKRSPQAVATAFGHAVVGHNRRVVYADGTAQMYGRTNRADFAWIEGFEDHSLDMLFTWNPAGGLTGVALSIPCPSQVDERLEQWSADFWHDIRLELRARLGAGLSVLPLCGAAGDQSPHFTVYGREEQEMRRRRGISERREIAARVADAVTRALCCTKPEPDDLPFAHAVSRQGLTPRQVSRAERDWAEAEFRRLEKAGPVDSWWPQRMRRVVEQGDGLYKPDPVPVELHALRVGHAVLTFNPFELFVDYALRIKARSPAGQTFVVQLAGDFGWYLPTERAVRGGGYGAMPAVCAVGPEGGAELVEETLRMISSLFPQPAS